MIHRSKLTSHRELSDYEFLIVTKLLEAKLKSTKGALPFISRFMGIITFALIAVMGFVFNMVGIGAGIFMLVLVLLCGSITIATRKSTQKLDVEGYGELERAVYSFEGTIGSQKIRAPQSTSVIGEIPTINNSPIISLPEWESFITYGANIGNTVTVEVVWTDVLPNPVVVSMTGLDGDRKKCWRIDTFPEE